MAPKKDPKKRPRKPQFEVGERVLCFRGPLLYEAECIKVSAKYRKVKYLIHYPNEGNDPNPVGWDDEWVPESRLLKYSEINLQKQKELFQASQLQSVRGKEVGPALGTRPLRGPQQNLIADSGEGPSVSTQAYRRNQNESESSGARNRVGSSGDQQEQCRPRGGEQRRAYVRKTDFKITMPAELKPWLVQDWNLITVQKKLFHLPAQKTVESILQEYELYERSNANSEDKIYAVPEVVAGIKAYFNFMLGTHLLYKFEKPQYAAIIASKRGVPVSQIYGAPHLLRLFVKIGDMLSYTFFDAHSTNLLLRYLHDFVNYLARNQEALFNSDDYELASPEYIQNAEAEPSHT
ncbi:mortality factor 4-like protein 1 [Antechinus flavipes]|uniref:mortality factor 4-like protein 1 n=1 Tax=Antechinus flavipes TaxID=38775 RepID=UPI00223574AE|nr:mortality factor 4-like protein 1 [Antechinus flavipes]